MYQDKNKNMTAMIVGIALVISIFVITYVRFSYSENKDAEKKNQLQDEIGSTMGKAAKISTDVLSKKIAAHEKMNLIDIRENLSFTKEHLPGATNIPLPEVKDSIGVLDKNSAYIIIDSDASLATTAYAIKIFKDAGFKNVSYLDGGFSAWKSFYGQTISAGDPNSIGDQSKVNYIDSNQLKSMLEKEKNITVIDIRKSADYGAGHLKNAINIFLDDLESRRSAIPMAGKIILYGDSGLESFQAAVRLFDMGVFNTYALSDGFSAWKEKHYETAE
jgi:hydroxyacylglutathione hydrolase